MEQTGSRKVTE